MEKMKSPDYCEAIKLQYYKLYLQKTEGIQNQFKIQCRILNAA